MLESVPPFWSWFTLGLGVMLPPLGLLLGWWGVTSKPPAESPAKSGHVIPG